MKTFSLMGVALLMLAGCSTKGDYQAYLSAQGDANRQALDAQKPLVRITAQPGQSITGLASLEVYTPTAAPVIQQARPNEWAGVLGQGLAITGTVMGIREAGKAAVGLADSVGRAGRAGYPFIQAPQANVTTTDMSNRSTTSSTVGDNSGSNSGNSGRIAGADITDTTGTPTVVTQPAPVVVTP